MKRYHPKEIVVENSVRNSPITENVLSRAPDVPLKYVESLGEKLEEARSENPSVARAKQSLVLAEHKGRFFKSCPGQQTRGKHRNICCDYFVINFASNCHMECTYCYLQSYLNFPYLIVYANIEQLIDELQTELSATPDRHFRIGTGELADSLATDHLTGYSRALVEFFAAQNNAVFELKTKSDCIENLIGLKHNGRTVVAWSVNPGWIQQTEEHKTATLEERLAAASKCVEFGYPVAFHFDPIIHYPNWKQDYRQVVRRIFATIPNASIVWISLGALRLAPSMRSLIRRRFPSSILPRGEFVPAEDGKLRYFKPIRVEMYRKMTEWISEDGPGTAVYACMERPEVWRKAFGKEPLEDQLLGDSLIQIVLESG
jgi:spore photoproduct lyase